MSRWLIMVAAALLLSIVALSRDANAIPPPNQGVEDELPVDSFLFGAAEWPFGWVGYHNPHLFTTRSIASYAVNNLGFNVFQANSEPAYPNESNSFLYYSAAGLPYICEWDMYRGAGGDYPPSPHYISNLHYSRWPAKHAAASDWNAIPLTNWQMELSADHVPGESYARLLPGDLLHGPHCHFTDWEGVYPWGKSRGYAQAVNWIDTPYGGQAVWYILDICARVSEQASDQAYFQVDVYGCWNSYASSFSFDDEEWKRVGFWKGADPNSRIDSWTISVSLHPELRNTTFQTITSAPDGGTVNTDLVYWLTDQKKQEPPYDPRGEKRQVYVYYVITYHDPVPVESFGDIAYIQVRDTSHFIPDFEGCDPTHHSSSLGQAINYFCDNARTGNGRWEGCYDGVDGRTLPIMYLCDEPPSIDQLLPSAEMAYLYKQWSLTHGDSRPAMLMQTYLWPYNGFPLDLLMWYEYRARLDEAILSSTPICFVAHPIWQVQDHYGESDETYRTAGWYSIPYNYSVDSLQTQLDFLSDYLYDIRKLTYDPLIGKDCPLWVNLQAFTSLSIDDPWPGPTPDRTITGTEFRCMALLALAHKVKGMFDWTFGTSNVGARQLGMFNQHGGYEIPECQTDLTRELEFGSGDNPPLARYMDVLEHAVFDDDLGWITSYCFDTDDNPAQRGSAGYLVRIGTELDQANPEQGYIHVIEYRAMSDTTLWFLLVNRVCNKNGEFGWRTPANPQACLLFFEAEVLENLAGPPPWSVLDWYTGVTYPIEYSLSQCFASGIVLGPGDGRLFAIVPSESFGPRDESNVSFGFDKVGPNPFNPTMTFRFGLPRRSEVHLEVYNVLGQRVAVVTEGEYPPGHHEVTWDASRFASGVYFARLRTGVWESETRKIVLLK